MNNNNYINKHNFKVQHDEGKSYGRTFDYEVTVSRQTASWKDNEDKPLEYTTYIGLFIDGMFFTGVSIYDWDGENETPMQWSFKGYKVAIDRWVMKVEEFLGTEGVLNLLEDINANKMHESEFTKYYQSTSPR